MVIRGKSVQPIDFGGLKIFDYTAGQDTSSSFAVITVPPGVEHIEAWSQRSDKYYYVISGSILFTLNGEIYELFSGDFCLVFQGQHFSYKNVTQEPAQIVLVHTPGFDPESEVFVV